MTTLDDAVKANATIAGQVGLADRFLEALETEFPEAVLAGGAPRDWSMGLPANDLDFYVYLSENMAPSVFAHKIRNVIGIVLNYKKRLADASFFENKTKEVKAYPEYKTQEDLLYITTITYYGQILQFMCMKKENFLEDLRENFSTSVWEIYYKAGALFPTERFNQTLADKIIRLNTDNKWSDYHPEKMYHRFSREGFRFEDSRSSGVVVETPTTSDQALRPEVTFYLAP